MSCAVSRDILLQCALYWKIFHTYGYERIDPNQVTTGWAEQKVGEPLRTSAMILCGKKLVEFFLGSGGNYGVEVHTDDVENLSPEDVQSLRVLLGVWKHVEPGTNVAPKAGEFLKSYFAKLTQKKTRLNIFNLLNKLWGKKE